MAWGRQKKIALEAAFASFLKRAQSNVGGFYEVTSTGRPVTFIRPLNCPFVRIQDMRDGSKTNALFGDLVPLNEMQVLAYMTWNEEDEKNIQAQERIEKGPETISTLPDEPQEPGDAGFLR